MKITTLKSVMRRKVKGQTLVIVGLLVGSGVLLGLVALAFDGGSALLQRRAMQNGADAASLGTAKMLAASVVLSGSIPVYSAVNQDVVSATNQFLTNNRGGVTGVPSYQATIEYGNFVPSTITSTSSYTFTVAAIYSGAFWSYTPPYLSNTLVPSWVDAVRVTASIDNPTTFGRAIGVTTIPVSAKAAAALRGTSNGPGGPTWPMTAAYSTVLTGTNNGLCHPVLFWQNVQSYKSLFSLAAQQGATDEGAHAQLLTAPDTRDGLYDKAIDYNGGGRTNQAVCGGSILFLNWSAAGSCSPPGQATGTKCCNGTSDISDIDVPNWITYDFRGTISVTTTRWIDNGWAPPNSGPGDWLETYASGNGGNNVITPLQDYINAHGQQDDLYPIWGLRVDMLMYFYDPNDEQIWETRLNKCPPNTIKGCWVTKANANPPDRVRMKAGLWFRFYQRLAHEGPGSGQIPLPPFCGGGSFNTSGSQIYGVFAGDEIIDPPPDPGPSGLFNYVGYIDP
jgi:Flp pilus assembly protein TadG